MKYALIAALLLFGCKKRILDTTDIDIARGYRDNMCACKDKECAAAVKSAYANAMPKTYGKDSYDELQQAVECEMKVMVAVTDTSSPPEGLPAMPAKPHSDQILAAARAWQREKHPKLALAEINIAYVEANGMLDPEHGKLGIVLGASNDPVDDPKRKTGAPVTPPERPSECPAVTFTGKQWQYHTESCRDVPSPPPKCSVEAIWKRALAEPGLNAPADALANMRYMNNTQATWTFNITDEPRKVAISHVEYDDCVPVVEKSQ